MLIAAQNCLLSTSRPRLSMRCKPAEYYRLVRILGEAPANKCFSTRDVRPVGCSRSIL
jgi:hypothetical protein